MVKKQIFSIKDPFYSFTIPIIVCVYIPYQAMGLMSRMFTNGPGDWGSIQGQVIPKTQKRYLMLPCLTLSTIR